MKFDDYWRIAKKWWWLILASTIVATISSAYSLSKEPRIYEAKTTVIVGQGLDKANPTYADFSIGQQLAQTYINMVQRKPILEGAAEALGLNYVPWAGNVSAQIVAGTQLVEIRVRDTWPERAQALADEIARQLIRQTPTSAAESSGRRTFVEEQLQALESNIEMTREEIANEGASLDAANSARAIQQYEANIDALERKLTTYQSTYATLLQSSQEATNHISIIEPASLPTTPVSPNVPETLILAAVIGMSLAAGGALLIEMLDNTIKTAEQAESTMELPILGAIATIQADEGQSKLITARDPLSPVTESFRGLRTSIDYYSVDKPLQSLMVTSAESSEGKSLLVANLAIVMAQSGRRVVVVDADMRRPVQHRLFNLINDHGLSDAIMARETDPSLYNHELDPGRIGISRPDISEPPTSDTILIMGRGSLRVVTTGPCPPNPADLLASKRMAELLEELKAQADIVLVDTPPVMVVTDAVVLSRLMDGVLILVSPGRTKRPTAQQALRRLRQVDANLLGVVLNRVSSRSEGYYGSYSNYYTRGEESQKATNQRDTDQQGPSQGEELKAL